MSCVFIAANSLCAGEISFRNDVMAVLSKAGCNQGICHGNQNGKGGFKLSLRGQDAAFDFNALSRDQSGRRTNSIAPHRSLVLLKATMQVPHQGGRRFRKDSREYKILADWITSGMPADPADTPRVKQLVVTPTDAVVMDPDLSQSLKITATFTDGNQRDVTTMAVYEAADPIIDVSRDGTIERLMFGQTTVTVRFLDQQAAVRVAFLPDRRNFQWTTAKPKNYIDEHIYSRLQQLRMNPSPVCDDTVFLRRAYLDLLGILPTANEARQFVADRSSDKRDKLIDELLERPEFADHWAQKWSDLLRNEEKTLDRKGVQNFYAWIRHGIATGKPLDQFVRELIASRGNTYSSPASNYYRAMREPLMRSESTAQLFLGIRLQCAKCHNHPFDRWTQDDYYSWANLFARVQYKVLENRRRDRNDKHEFDGTQVVYMSDEGEVTHPGRGESIPPRFLASADSKIDDNGDRLEQLAVWLTAADNSRFAKSQVNRIWYNLMGRGIVEPIDDFRATNPAANPQLLDALANDFVKHRFHLRSMIRTIMRSNTYQFSAEPNETNHDDAANFSHVHVRRLTAEQLIDCFSQVTGAPIEFNGYPIGTRAGELPGVRAIRLRDQTPSQGDQFLKLFGKPPRLQSCECERSDESTLSQSFQLISGPLLNELLMRPDNRITKLVNSKKSDSEIIDELYWTAFSRPPTNDENLALTKHLESTSNRRKALEDIMWSLLNVNEFLLRR